MLQDVVQSMLATSWPICPVSKLQELQQGACDVLKVSLMEVGETGKCFGRVHYFNLK